VFQIGHPDSDRRLPDKKDAAEKPNPNRLQTWNQQKLQQNRKDEQFDSQINKEFANHRGSSRWTRQDQPFGGTFEKSVDQKFGNLSPKHRQRIVDTHEKWVYLKFFERGGKSGNLFPNFHGSLCQQKFIRVLKIRSLFEQNNPSP
jgi:hypothetical protein